MYNQHNTVTIHNITFSSCRFDDNQWPRASEGAWAAPLASRPVVATAASPIAPIVAAPEVGTGGFRSATVMGTPVVIPDDDYGKQLGTQREVAAAKKRSGKRVAPSPAAASVDEARCLVLNSTVLLLRTVRFAGRQSVRNQTCLPLGTNFQLSLQRWRVHSLHSS